MSIIENRKAFHDYFIEEKHEAGMVLEGWEVKAIRAGRSNIKESYVVVRGEEIFLFGMHITPLATASSHVHHDPTRTRKLLLHKKEIARLIGKVERAGYTLVPLDMATSKLLANADRWSDDGVFSRDVIDLAMMNPSLPLLRKALLKAQGAYGETIARDLERAIERLQNRPDWLERCMQVMAIDLPKAVLWSKIRALRRVLA